jgi:hypothetical protein
MTRIRLYLARFALAALALVLIVTGADVLRAQTTTALTGNVAVRVQMTHDATLDLGTSRLALDKDYTIAFTTTGAGANAVNRLFTDTRTLSASATEDLDLAGVLTDSFGQTLTFARIKYIVIKAAAANTNSVQITRPASNGLVLFMAASDGLSLAPGEVFVWVSPGASGKAVTASTGDLLTITNSAGTTGVTYDVIIGGSST